MSLWPLMDSGPRVRLLTSVIGGVIAIACLPATSPPLPLSRIANNCFNTDTGGAPRTACFANKRIRAGSSHERRETCVDFNRSALEGVLECLHFVRRTRRKVFRSRVFPSPLSLLRSIIESARALTCSFDLVYNVLTHRTLIVAALCATLRTRLAHT